MTAGQAAPAGYRPVWRASMEGIACVTLVCLAWLTPAPSFHIPFSSTLFIRG